MDEGMTQRVMEWLRVDRPHHDDEMLRELATNTALGAAVAWRITVEDFAEWVIGKLESFARLLRR